MHPHNVNTYLITRPRVHAALLSVVLFFSSAATAQDSGKRGIVLYPSDIISVGVPQWMEWLEDSHINLLGIHTDTHHEPLPNLKAFLESTVGQELLRSCQAAGIDIEFEVHALQDLLPRGLFASHPDFFRMDAKGKRQQEFNMCFTSEGAYAAIEAEIREITQWMKPTTHRYFFWTDDVPDASCFCLECKIFSASEQALRYENRLLKILRGVDPQATLAHLAYNETLSAPQQVKPAPGIFLEYAPISRNYALPLSEDHFVSLKKNLAVFPAATAHVLEYWVDVSMFSSWKRDALKKAPWVQAQCVRDVETYQSLGINSITSFGAWINQSYLTQYGEEHVTLMLKEYGEALLNELPKKLTLPRIENADMALDGKLSEPQWPQAVIRSDFTYPWRKETPPPTTFHAFRDATYFYFAFTVADGDIVTATDHTAELSVAEGDRVEIFLAGKARLENYYCIEMGPTGRVLDYQATYYRHFDDSWNCPGLEVGTHQSAGQYTIEGRIPLKALEAMGVVPDGDQSTLSIGLFRAEFSKNPAGDEPIATWISWKTPASEEPDFHIPSSFGQLRF